MSKRKTTARPRTNHSPGWKSRKQTERRKIAEARNVVYSKLTPQQKLTKLDSEGFVATKQRAKLQALIKS